MGEMTVGGSEGETRTVNGCDKYEGEGEKVGWGGGSGVETEE